MLKVKNVFKKILSLSGEQMPYNFFSFHFKALETYVGSGNPLGTQLIEFYINMAFFALTFKKSCIFILNISW